MHRRWIAALVVVLGAGASFVSSTDAYAITRPAIQVSPAGRLTNNQSITISGTGLGLSKNGSLVTWFASECTTKALGRHNLDPDFSPHCSATLVKPLRVSPRGSFSVKFKVATGKVADGDCGVPGALTCVIAVGTATGRHVTARIRFKNIAPPPPKATTTTKPKAK